MSTGETVAVALSALAGIAGSIQVAVMGRLGERVGTLQALAFSTLLTGALALGALAVVARSVDGVASAARQPVWMLSGGLLGAFIVFTVTVAGPRIGTAATIGLLIAGQLAMGAAIDRFGLFGAERIPLSWQRATGILLLAAGSALVLRR